MKAIFVLLALLIGSSASYAQYSKNEAIHPLLRSITGKDNDLFGTRASFIENIGQYSDTIKGYGKMGKILYGYEGFGMPVLFTPKGLIHLQRKVEQPSKEAIEKMEKNGMKEDEIRKKVKAIDRTITMEWVGSNPNVQIIAEDVQSGYHTYGFLKCKARVYKKITFKDVYPGINIEYSFLQDKIGFEYKIIVAPGADISKVKMKYSGDVKAIKLVEGNLEIKSDISEITETAPLIYSSNRLLNCRYKISKANVYFDIPTSFDTKNGFTIDPFVTTNTFPSSQIRDVDFDYAGNIYISGGGNPSITQLAKFDAGGIWQWTFSGSLTSPVWHAGGGYGGWSVERSTGKIYLGGHKDFGVFTSFDVIRLSSDGTYDNYKASSDFQEDWRIKWTCNNSFSQLYIGGGGSSQIDFGLLSPPSNVITSFGMNGEPANGQDVADIIVDPITNDIYSIYGTYPTDYASNRIYKNKTPYGPLNIIWNVPSGFHVLVEAANRPYLLDASGKQDNSANLFALNSSYLFYWDGFNLTAFNKVSGNSVGNSLTFPDNTPLWSGGIVADDCGNVFVGYINGIIKVFKFDGNTFDDSPPDITIPGYSNAYTHDLKYDYAKHLLYACGNGYIASFDVSSYCGRSVTVQANCSNSSAQAAIIPVPQPGTNITYFLYDGTSLITSNTTGLFTSLTPGITYTIKSYIDRQCQSIETDGSFSIPVPPTIFASSTNALCSSNNGTITVNASGGAAPLQYSINGATYQSSNLFSGLSANNYTVYVKDANGCITTTPVTINDESAPSLSANTTSATCTNDDGSITATAFGGKAPLQYSIDGTTFQSSNIFTGLASGNYTVTVKDANNCVTASSVTVSSTSFPPVTGISIYPNPTSDNRFTIVLGNQLQGSYSIRILDMTGQLVYKTLISNACTCCSGSYSVKLPFLLSSGVYYVEVVDPQNNKAVKRLMVTNTK